MSPSHRRTRLWWGVPAIIGLIALAWVLAATQRHAAPGETGRTAEQLPAAATAPPAPASPASLASATPPEQRLVRDLTGRCLPEPGKRECDALRAGLWAGDPETWRRWAALRGEPPPSAAQVQTATIDMRLAAGDPVARADLARATGRPLPLIAALHVQAERGGPQVVALELVNLGAAAADLSGVMLPGGGRIAAGATLTPGRHCTVGPAAGAAACPFTVTGAGRLTAVPGDHLRLLTADGRELDDFVVP